MPERGSFKACRTFDKELAEWTERVGGTEYAHICSLAYRQTVAAHKLIEDREGNLLFLSKECLSNGCIGTVDISYPSMPLYLLYNPELVKGMLRPVFRFSKMPVWQYDFAPHDVGRYPYVTGQVYGVKQEYGLGEQHNGRYIRCTIFIRRDRIYTGWRNRCRWRNAAIC